MGGYEAMESQQPHKETAATQTGARHEAQETAQTQTQETLGTSEPQTRGTQETVQTAEAQTQGTQEKQETSVTQTVDTQEMKSTESHATQTQETQAAVVDGGGGGGVAATRADSVRLAAIAVVSVVCWWSGDPTLLYAVERRRLTPGSPQVHPRFTPG